MVYSIALLNTVCYNVVEFAKSQVCFSLLIKVSFEETLSWNSDQIRILFYEYRDNADNSLTRPYVEHSLTYLSKFESSSEKPQTIVFQA